mgnify:CR=1 FL=1
MADFCSLINMTCAYLDVDTKYTNITDLIKFKLSN